MTDIVRAIYDMMGKYTYPVLKTDAPRQHVDAFFQVKKSEFLNSPYKNPTTNIVNYLNTTSFIFTVSGIKMMIKMDTLVTQKIKGKTKFNKNK